MNAAAILAIVAGVLGADEYQRPAVDRHPVTCLEIVVELGGGWVSVLELEATRPDVKEFCTDRGPKRRTTARTPRRRPAR